MTRLVIPGGEYHDSPSSTEGVGWRRSRWVAAASCGAHGSAAYGTPLADALFTAVSTICVTGLSTVDMATYWSPFGNAVVFIGMNIGGVGVLTLASILGLVISRRLELRAKLIAASDTNPSRIHVGPVSESQAIRLGEVGGLLVTVAASLLVIEAVIAIGMVPSMLAAGYDFGTSAWYSSYYSVSASRTPGSAPTPRAPWSSSTTTGSSRS